MDFVIKGLKRHLFKGLFTLSTVELAEKNIVRTRIRKHDGAPCRLSFADLDPGESALLLNYQHLSDHSPFQSSHAIYVGENSSEVRLSVNEVPKVMQSRLLSVRVFDADQMMIDADVVEGTELNSVLKNKFNTHETEFIDIHYAKPGCWGGRAYRETI